MVHSEAQVVVTYRRKGGSIQSVYFILLTISLPGG